MLEHLVTGACYPLVSRTVVGRSRDCQIQLSHARASGMHAELIWDGERWSIHDLGSRNGTRVDGQRLPAETYRELTVGSELAFGSVDERFVLRDVSPPGLVAISDDGVLRYATGGLLCLPFDDEPQVTIAQQQGSDWQVESAEGTRTLADRQRVAAADQIWTIHLPGAIRVTEGGDEEPMTVDRVALAFEVSRDEEHVQMHVQQGQRTLALRPRAHDFFLLTLARARIADQAQPGLEEGEHGWVYRQELAQRLKVDRRRINLWVYRARRQFADAGLLGVTNLVERREGAEQLRMGIARLHVG